MTLAVEAAALTAIATTIGALGAVASTALTIQQAQKANARASQAARLAREKAARDKLASDAKAAQERANIARRLSIQVDSARVVAGAAGVSGGASQMVLESSFAADAKTDLATVDANQGRGVIAGDINLSNNLNQIDATRINPFAAAVTGVAQGVGAFTSIRDGLTRIIPTVPGQAPPAPIPFAGNNVNPTTGGGTRPGGGLIDTPVANPNQQVIV